VKTNVAILLTPPQPAAIAVVRIAGPKVREFLDTHFNKSVVAGRSVHGEIRDGDQVLDDAVVVFNGDRADLNLHGGPWVVRSVLVLAERNGFQILDRLESPLPDAACEGDTPLRREIFASLPLATTELALRTLLEQEIAWRNGIDDPEEMLDDKSLWWLLHPPRVALAGAPNVGKSTLANQLFAQERSITADVAGTTRDWVGETANLDGLAVVLIDTPGIHQTTDAIESAAIRQAAGEVAAADLVVLVLDVTRDDGQTALLETFPEGMRVLNKSDLPVGWNVPSGTPVSAKTGQGMDDLRSAIRRHFQIDHRWGEAKWWTVEQWDSLRNSMPGPPGHR
jgi:small GTP-binding protein